MIRQDDPRFASNPNIKEFACVLFCYLYYGNKLAGAQMGVQEILGYISDFQAQGWLTGTMTVQQPDKILEKLGVQEAEIVKAEDPAYICKDGEYEICMWGYMDMNGKWWEHAIAGTGNGGQAFDPLGLSHCGRLGKIVTKRIITVGA